VTSAIIGHDRGAGLRLHALAQLLVSVVDVVPAQRHATGAVAPGKRKRLAEHVTDDVGVGLFRVRDRDRIIGRWFVPGQVGSGGLLAPRAGNTRLETAQIGSGRRQYSQLTVLTDRGLPSQGIVFGPDTVGRRTTGTRIRSKEHPALMVEQ